MHNVHTHIKFQTLCEQNDINNNSFISLFQLSLFKITKLCACKILLCSKNLIWKYLL